MTVVWILFLLMVLIFQYTFAFQEYSKIIIISDEGNITTECCIDGKCPCSSLEIALQNVNNKTLINITSAKETLPVQINITYISVIGIAGSNGTVIDCNNTGGVLFLNCGEIDVFGITWYQCGNNKLHGAISLDHSHNISITYCTFQSSNIHGIAVEPLPGKIVIKDTEFLYNNISGHSSGLFIQQTKEGSTPVHLELTIIRSVFHHNGGHPAHNTAYGGGISIFINDSSSQVNFLIEDSVFTRNIGSIGGGMYVSTNGANNSFNVVIQIKNVSFRNNIATTITDIFNGSAVHYETTSKNSSFTIRNSTIHNSMVILSSALHNLVLIDKSMWGSVKGGFSLSIEVNFNLYANFSNTNIVGTRISIITVKKDSKYYILKFDRSNISNDSFLAINGQGTKICQCTINNCQFSNNNIHTPIIDIQMDSSDTQSFTHISNTNFSDNSNMGGSIIHLAYQSIMGDVQLSSVAFTGNTAAESTLYVYNCKMKITDKLSFTNNAGKRGAAIYFDHSYAVLSDNADIEFKNNVAALGGGAIYAECPDDDYTWLLFHQTGKSVTFINNVATEIGNSIYFSIPRDDIITRDPTLKSSIMYIPSQFNYSGKSYQSEIATSPYNLILNPPAVCVSTQCDNGGDYTIEGIMLGEELTFTAKTLDYFNNSAEGVIFMIECNNNCKDYSLTGFTNYKSVFIQENSLGDHVVCTYLSPDIQYFTGRHIIYTIVAVICLIVIAIGLPVFLLLQPYLKKSRRINFIRILPLLDQFQQCFKTKYHSVAAFYLICRLLIFVILGMDMIQYSTRFLILQIFCFTIAMIHAWLQPYKENKLNSHDQTILLITLMIVSLSAGVAYTSLNGNTEMNDSIVAILALLPLVLFVGFMLSSTALGRLLWQKLACNTVNVSHHGSAVRSVS